MLFFTTTGRVFKLKAYDVPQASRTAKGQALVNFLQLGQGESVTSVLSLDELLGQIKYLMMVTRGGVIKKVDLSSFDNVRRSGLIAIKLREGDRLQWVRPSTGKDNVLLITQAGQAIRFEEKDVRDMGRVATGVRGIRLKGGDSVVGMSVVSSKCESKDCDVVVVMQNGYGKRSSLAHYKVQGRGGSGIKTAKLTGKTGHIVWGAVVQIKSKADADLIIISSKGQVIRLPFKSVSAIGRDTQGVRLMSFREKGDTVANVTFIDDEKKLRELEA